MGKKMKRSTPEILTNKDDSQNYQIKTHGIKKHFIPPSISCDFTPDYLVLSKAFCHHRTAKQSSVRTIFSVCVLGLSSTYSTCAAMQFVQLCGRLSIQAADKMDFAQTITDEFAVRWINM